MLWNDKSEYTQCPTYLIDSYAAFFTLTLLLLLFLLLHFILHLSFLVHCQTMTEEKLPPGWSADETVAGVTKR